MRPLILASSSPRRREILTEMGVAFEVVTAPVEELTQPGHRTVEEMVLENAQLKADAVLPLRPESWILGADTVVELDGRVFGKPRDLTEAKLFLRALSGRTHRVLTGVALVRSQAKSRTFCVTTEVRFKSLNDGEIQTYLERVPVLDKAGAYAAQEGGELIIEQIIGSRSNVIGLPQERLAEELFFYWIVERSIPGYWSICIRHLIICPNVLASRLK